MEFDDGQPALDYMKTRGSAKGVILISDAKMKELNGFQLLSTLSEAALLPEQTMICSNISDAIFPMLMENVGLPKDRAKFAHKEVVKYVLRDWLPAAFWITADKIGIAMKSSKNAPPGGEHKPN